MILTNNNHKFYNDVNNYLSIENGLIFGKYPFYYAKDDHNILVVNKTHYDAIINDILCETKSPNQAENVSR